MSSRVSPRWPSIHKVIPVGLEFTVHTGLSKPEPPGLLKWVTSWEECGSQECLKDPGSQQSLDWGVVKSKVIVGGSNQKRAQAGALRGVRGVRV